MGTAQCSMTQQPTSGTCHLGNFEYVANHSDWKFMIPIIQDQYNMIKLVWAHPIALEEVSKTQHGPCWVFQCLLAIAEVNVCHAAGKIFGQEKLMQQEFCLQLAKGMIFNTFNSCCIKSIIMPMSHWAWVCLGQAIQCDWTAKLAYRCLPRLNI